MKLLSPKSHAHCIYKPSGIFFTKPVINANNHKMILPISGGIEIVISPIREHYIERDDPCIVAHK